MSGVELEASSADGPPTVQIDVDEAAYQVRNFQQCCQHRPVQVDVCRQGLLQARCPASLRSPLNRARCACAVYAVDLDHSTADLLVPAGRTIGRSGWHRKQMDEPPYQSFCYSAWTLSPVLRYPGKNKMCKKRTINCTVDPKESESAVARTTVLGAGEDVG